MLKYKPQLDLCLQVLQGNYETDTIRYNKLEEVVRTDAVKLIIVNYHSRPCLRFEVYGCRGIPVILTTKRPRITTTREGTPTGVVKTNTPPTLQPRGNSTLIPGRKSTIYRPTTAAKNSTKSVTKHHTTAKVVSSLRPRTTPESSTSPYTDASTPAPPCGLNPCTGGCFCTRKRNRLINTY